MNSWGGRAEYIVESTYYGPGGIQRPEYEIWQEPFDLAADYMISASVAWHFCPRGVVILDYRKTGPIPYAYGNGSNVGEYSSPDLVGLAIRLEDVLIRNTIFTVAAENIFDRNSLVPGTYGPEQGEPFSMVFTMSYRF